MGVLVWVSRKAGLKAKAYKLLLSKGSSVQRKRRREAVKGWGSIGECATKLAAV